MTTVKIGIISVFLLLAMLVPFASALTITMANPDTLGQRDIIVYYPNGTMQGFYNTTSIIDIDGNSSYIFTLKPQASNPLDDPGEFLNIAFDYVTTNIVALLVMIFLIALLLGRK